jgi:regulator of protease activity HflC (stomatin/prohibitin superfamily)
VFDRLLDVALELSKWAAPVAHIQPWEGGVRITSFLSRQRVRAIGPGLHFKIPFIQIIETTEVVTTTQNLPPQSLTTKDGKSVTVSGIIKFSIKDVVPLFTSVVDREDVLRDVALGAIHRAVRSREWGEIIKDQGTLEKEVRSSIADDVNKLGFKIERFTFSDLASVRTIRLMQELPQK